MEMVKTRDVVRTDLREKVKISFCLGTCYL